MEVERAVVTTLAYADVFDYPLSLSEIFRYLIAKKAISYKKIVTFLRVTPKIIKKNGFYCFGDRGRLAITRQLRQEINKKKMQKAKRIAQMIGVLPTVSLVGVSGAVAMQNAKVDDDIDFFIITKTNALWLTRFLLFIFLASTGNIRLRNNHHVRDKICLNMLLDESALSFSKSRQTLYTAHEIIQMKPIFVKNDIYNVFLESNAWVKKYMPNAIDSRMLGYKDIRKKESKAPSILLSQYLNVFLIPFELLAKKIQLWYMKPRIKETITNHVLAFHPRDYEHEIMEAYTKRMHIYGAL